MSERRTGPVTHEPVRTPDDASERAAHRTSFPILVSAELRKLTDTTVGRVLLVAAAPVMLLLTFMSLAIGQDATVSGQLGSVVAAIEIGQVLVHAALIRSITAEWLYGTVQNLALVQPSRLRYVLSQVSMAGVLWLGCSAVQIVFALALGPPVAARSGVPYLLGDQMGWLVAVCLLGSLLGMLAALVVSLLVLNPTGALAAYFIAVPVLVIAGSVEPRLSWVNPFTAVTQFATMNGYAVPQAGFVSLALWVGLLAVSARRICRTDIE